jgi:hypothetical protein
VVRGDEQEGGRGLPSRASAAPGLPVIGIAVAANNAYSAIAFTCPFGILTQAFLLSKGLGYSRGGRAAMRQVDFT